MIKKSYFGATLQGEKVYAYTISNKSCEATVISYGATLTSLKVPSYNGLTDVVLGYDDLLSYQTNDGYLGATVGRNSNRIKNAAFNLFGAEYKLNINDKGVSNLHGGPTGFSYRVFDVLPYDENDVSVEFSYFSKNGEENFPGDLLTYVKYTLTENCELKIEYNAKTDKTTLCNLTNHTYFNLNGEGNEGAHDNYLKINANYFTPGDEYLIPTGEILSVENTPFDFRNFKRIDQDINANDIQIKHQQGYDVNFCLSTSGEITTVATAYSTKTGIEMNVLTDRPGIQLYTGAFLTERKGKNGHIYTPNTSFCLETQTYPAAANISHFPSAVLKTNEKFISTTIYAFTVKK